MKTQEITYWQGDQWILYFAKGLAEGRTVSARRLNCETLEWSAPLVFEEKDGGLYALWHTFASAGVREVWRICEDASPVLQARVLVSLHRVDVVR